jgi:hypothetical protein
VVTPGSIVSTSPIVANVGTLPPGGTATLTFRVSVNASALGQTISNVAQANSDQQASPVSTEPVEPQPGGGRVYPAQLYLPLVMK